jgi:hypothetical protein
MSLASVTWLISFLHERLGPTQVELYIVPYSYVYLQIFETQKTLPRANPKRHFLAASISNRKYILN